MPTTSDFTIVFLGQEPFDKGGVSSTRYRYSVEPPRGLSPPTLGASWPTVPRVGTSVAGIFFATEEKLPKKFEAFYGGMRETSHTWYFELAADVVPPSWVKLVVGSPPADREYQSNLAETTL